MSKNCTHSTSVAGMRHLMSAHTKHKTQNKQNTKQTKHKTNKTQNRQNTKQTKHKTKHKTKTNHTKPNQTKPNQTKPNQTKPNQTKPNQTKPNQNQTKPNQTKPNNQHTQPTNEPRTNQPTNQPTTNQHTTHNTQHRVQTHSFSWCEQFVLVILFHEIATSPRRARARRSLARNWLRPAGCGRLIHSGKRRTISCTAIAAQTPSFRGSLCGAEAKHTTAKRRAAK